MRAPWKRRRFLRGLTLAGAAGVLGFRLDPAAAEPPPETTRLRLNRSLAGGAGCSAPQYVAEDLFRAEGFTDVAYLPMPRAEYNVALASGTIDLNVSFIGSFVVQLDKGDPIVVLAGTHVGCFELFAHEHIRTIRDLKGKAVGITETGSGRHVFLASALAYVGLDPRRDVRLVQHPPAESVQLFAEGKLDAYQAFEQEAYELRDRKIGRVLLDSTRDRPWSQHFCCMVAANREFVRRHPVAAKRALRALLRATDICGLDPEGAARPAPLLPASAGRPYANAVRLFKELPYRRWREFDPEGTVRFYALRLREAGMIKADPPRLVAQGTDWRFLNELKKELKG